MFIDHGYHFPDSRFEPLFEAETRIGIKALAEIIIIEEIYTRLWSHIGQVINTRCAHLQQMLSESVRLFYCEKQKCEVSNESHQLINDKLSC